MTVESLPNMDDIHHPMDELKYELHLDEEFAGLIPPLSTDELEGLKQNILAEGCRDGLVIWNSTIVDGHNRYSICREHRIPFSTIPKFFETREEAKAWIITNQLGRRNLTKYDRSKLALGLKDIFAARAKQNEKTHTKEGYLKSANPPVHTNEELAKAAGVSKDTMRKVEVIEEEGTPEQKELVRNRKKSINKAFKEIRQPKTNPNNESKEKKAVEKMSEEFRAALSELAIVVKKEQETKWRETDKEAAMRKIKALLDIIAK